MIPKSIINALFLAIVIGLNSCSPQINTGLTVATNFKNLGINEKISDRLDSLFATALVNQWTAGATILVAKNGKIFYNKGFGFRDRETKALLRITDEFRIASLTKPIISLTALALIEKGKLSLDDKVYKYIPEFANPKTLLSYSPKDTTYTSIPANTEITVRHLLTQTSGIGGVLDSPLALIYQKNKIPVLASADKITLADKMKQLANLPLAFNPNSAFYDGLSSDVLGAIIEKASGLTLDSAVSKTILRPLGMQDTHFFLPLLKANRLAVMYTETQNERLERTPLNQQKLNLNYPISGAKSYLSASSGLVSTTQDYAKFLQMILNKGMFNNKQIVSVQSVEQATQNQIGNLLAGNNQYGFGFTIATNADLQSGSKAGKLSGKGEFNTFYWIDPQRNTIAVLFTQVYPATHGQQLLNDFERLVNEILDGK
ncbi:MAG: class A beta-lactamase-related serine hydrolase [Sphingobacteriales bacterium]|nr:MAG: class A beta-lactamase-related serine hydrolase [Sphingobacteriales bacterium]